MGIAEGIAEGDVAERIRQHVLNHRTQSERVLFPVRSIVIIRSAELLTSAMLVSKLQSPQMQ